MENRAKFPETVMLLDAALLDSITVDFKKNFQKLLNRPIQDMDIAQLVINLALDADLPLGTKEIHVILVYDQSTPAIRCCNPSLLESELNGVAFQDDDLGEFIFISLSPQDMVSREEFFLDLMEIIGENTDVKHLMIAAPFEGKDMEEALSLFRNTNNKKITLFSISEPQKKNGFTWQTLGYPIMQAMGIRGEELQ